MQKAKADADLRVASATERLSLADKLRRAEAEILVLKDENQQLKAMCSRLESAASDNEKVLRAFGGPLRGMQTRRLPSRIGSLSWSGFRRK